MKHLLLLASLCALLYGCASQPPYTDTGTPGQIKVIAFYDDNKNGVMDGAEAGTQTKVAISQEVSCPPSGHPSWLDTDTAGTYTFQDLKPGKYCIISLSAMGYTTKVAPVVYVSSDRVTTVAFGLVRP
ncbi:MAG TPA: carboxypeptidase-like regulatory domain-containing protein [Anaerolineales bacterium]|nr:carboxypeptidase-like regulatory domain-containing protein [Anaerolineales bacterium]